MSSPLHKTVLSDLSVILPFPIGVNKPTAGPDRSSRRSWWDDCMRQPQRES